MGFGQSKPLTDAEKYVFDRRRIFFDNYGNVRYSGYDAPLVDREIEARKILEVDSGADKTPGLTWYLMDSVWVESWLQYVHLDGECPRPGPCRNDRLITFTEDGRWVGRSNMSMAVRARSGDYRRVTEAAWNAFKSYYPESGPVITTVYTYEERLADTGLYDVSNWIIIPDTMLEEKTKRILEKRKKKIKLGKGLHNMADKVRQSISLGNTSIISSISMDLEEKRPSQEDDMSMLLDSRTSPRAASGSGSGLSSPLSRDRSSRSFLGSKASNEPKEPGVAYKKVQDDRTASVARSEYGAEEGVFLQAISKGNENVPAKPDSYFSGVFFGSGAEETE